MKKLIIVGCGITGLTTALELSKYYNIEVYDKDHYTKNTSYKSPGLISTYPFYKNISKLNKILDQDNILSFILNNIYYLLQIGINNNTYLNDKSNEDIINFKNSLNCYDKKNIIEKLSIHLFNKNIDRKSNKYINSETIKNKFNIDNKYGILDKRGGNIEMSNIMNILFNKCKQENIKFFFNHKITNINIENNKINSLESNGKKIYGDKFIICASNGTKEILKKHVYVPTIPLYGYFARINKPIYKNDINIIDIDEPIIIKRAKNTTLCASGFYVNKNNLDRFKKHVDKSLQNMFHKKYKIDEYWIGDRCVTPDLFPIIDKVYDNLYINCGGGTRGITWSFTSAKLMKDIVHHEKESIYKLNRFKKNLGKNIIVLLLILLIISKIKVHYF